MAGLQLVSLRRNQPRRVKYAVVARRHHPAQTQRLVAQHHLGLRNSVARGFQNGAVSPIRIPGPPAPKCLRHKNIPITADRSLVSSLMNL